MHQMNNPMAFVFKWRHFTRFCAVDAIMEIFKLGFTFSFFFLSFLCISHTHTLSAISATTMRSTLALVRASYSHAVKPASIRPMLSLSQRGKHESGQE